MTRTSATPISLRDRARELEIEAENLRREADLIEQLRESREHTARRQKIIRDVAASAWRGYTDEQLAGRLAGRLEISIRSARLLLDKELSRHARARAARRNREIMRLAFRGATNRELAARFDLCEKYISQIISKALRRGHGLDPDVNLAVPRTGRRPLSRALNQPSGENFE